MLTSFARNIASVLSTTLLSDYQDSPVNHSSTSNLLKRIQDAQPPLEIATNRSEGSENASFARYPRSTRESSSNEGETAFHNPFILTNHPPRYSKYYEPASSSYKPYQFTVNARIPYNEVNTPENLNIKDTKDNSVNEDVNATPLHYPGFGYKPEPVDPLPNHYAQLGVRHHRLPTQRPVDPRQRSTPEREVDTEDENGNNNQVARITRRPYNLNYRGSFHNSYYALPFQGQFYRSERPVVEGEDRYATNGRDESDRLEDQNQGQTALGGYDYGPRFHHGLPPYHAFHHGFPGFYPRPYNDTFHPGYNKEQGDGNGTGPQPYGPPFYHDPKFAPHHQPFYPNFYGRPVQNPGENQGDPEQIVAPENGQSNNATYHGPPFGYPPPYGPYGPFNLHAYPLVPFGGYRFGFHDHHLFSGIKSVPYFYHHFPLSFHWNPYHYYNHRPATTTEKPAEKTVNSENSEASASNSEAETLSEIKSSERTRASASRGYKKRFSSGFVVKEGIKVAGDRTLNQLS